LEKDPGHFLDSGANIASRPECLGGLSNEQAVNPKGILAILEDTKEMVGTSHRFFPASSGCARTGHQRIGAGTFHLYPVLVWPLASELPPSRCEDMDALIGI
jgi:hypothetical protein